MYQSHWKDTLPHICIPETEGVHLSPYIFAMKKTKHLLKKLWTSQKLGKGTWISFKPSLVPGLDYL